MREVAFEERFVDRDILDGDDGLARYDIQYTVDEQHRITMRQPLHDRLDVQFHFVRFPTVLNYDAALLPSGGADQAFSSARRRRRSCDSCCSTAALRCHSPCSA